ncbi:MAG: hypothetical protein JNM81_00310 [Rhodospirillaceae bacterium]|nr:hypothetical protein [Rhodospirillaceae bacterium]
MATIFGPTHSHTNPLDIAAWELLANDAAGFVFLDLARGCFATALNLTAGFAAGRFFAFGFGFALMVLAAMERNVTPCRLVQCKI